jgi:hypothetical protein
MPRLSLYRPNKQNDYRFFDRTISEQLTVGGTDLYIHKYAGITNQGQSVDPTQPQYLEPDPTQIQDLLFLENRDRKYDTSIYRLRGHYNVQNLDFDLSQFGLFLNNDIIFITVHYNDMIDIIGRKLMVGDALELPHLLDYNPLDETIPVALKRFMQITDANYASEGFSQTWFPHLWRIKCEPLVNSEEFADILNAPTQQDNYLGDFDPTKTYPPGYTVTYGGVIYKSKTDVPIGTTPPNSTYWEVVEKGSIADILSTYNKNIAINDAALRDAQRLLPKSGYDTSKLYIVPTYGEYAANNIPSGKYDQPAPPININTQPGTTPGPPAVGTVMMVNNPRYRNSAAGIKIKKSVLESIWDMTADSVGFNDKIDKFVQAQLSVIEKAPQKTDIGSGSVETDKILNVQSFGIVLGPYGTADNTYATADQDPEAPGFTGDVTINMNYRADCIPGYQYIVRASPRTFGYTTGYMTGDGQPPNGLPLGVTGLASPTGAGISFPQNPQVGDYFLRIDYLPQLLYRWDGNMWIRISENVRTETGFGSSDQSLLSSFINNSEEIYLNNEGKLVPEAQPLSTILQPKPDVLPPE